MIPNKNLFTGALGKTQNIGGSKLFSTPHTIEVPPDYSVETDVPAVAEFLTSSFDGRLWLFRRSRRFYLAVLRWDNETQRLVFVSSAILSNENLIRRGIDWILTDKSFILASDDEPYFSRTEYASDDSTYINAINQSYSFFPEFEAWQKIINGQTLHIQGSPSDSWNIIPQTKLIPLEFHYYSDDKFLAITDFNTKVCYCNGLLYAKGKAHIGRAYLLPRSFSENGDIEDFYLYISPDYKRAYDSENQGFHDNDEWDNFIIAPLNENSVCFFIPDNEDHGFCKKPVQSKVISLPQLEQLDFSSHNGTVFFDGITQSNLVLNDSGASLLHDNILYDCKGLRQWIAPAGSVKTVSPAFILATSDQCSICSFWSSGLYRALLHSEHSFIVNGEYQNKSLVMANSNEKNVKNIIVHEANMTHGNKNNAANWVSSYKKFLDISVLNFSHYEGVYSNTNPLWCSRKYSSPTNIVRIFYSGADYTENTTWTGSIVVYKDVFHDYETIQSYSGTEHFNYSAAINGFYILLDDGSTNDFSASKSLPNPFELFEYSQAGCLPGEWPMARYATCKVHELAVTRLSQINAVEKDGAYFWVITDMVRSPIENDVEYLVETDFYSMEDIYLYTYGFSQWASSTRYEPVEELAFLHNVNSSWSMIDASDSSFSCLIILTKIENGIATFINKASGIDFTVDLTSITQENFRSCYNFYNHNSSYVNELGHKVATDFRHLACNNLHFIVLKSSYHPDIFNFDAEFERSKFS